MAGTAASPLAGAFANDDAGPAADTVSTTTAAAVALACTAASSVAWSATCRTARPTGAAFGGRGRGSVGRVAGRLPAFARIRSDAAPSAGFASGVGADSLGSAVRRATPTGVG